MLHSLSIKNFALIEDVTLQLNSGFSTITGETGAGKSILLGALSLLLGKRADLSIVRDATKKCTIEGSFNVKNYNLKQIFNDQDLDYEDQTIIRREILPSGKSRAFINDTPVNLSAMQVLGELLVDIHSQHETLSLGNQEYQYLVLDTYAETLEDLSIYRLKLSQLKARYNQLETLKAEAAEAQKTHDYNLFLLEELEKAQLRDGLLEELEERQQQLSNVELLKESLGETSTLFQDENLGILEQLRQSKRKISQVQDMSKINKELYERLESAIVELEDVSITLEREYDNIEDNPAELEEVNEKLQLIYNLFKKHNADTIGDLQTIEANLAGLVLKSKNASGNISKLEAEISTEKEALKTISKSLTLKREKASKPLIREIESVLSGLGMQNANIKVTIRAIDKFTQYGSEDMFWELSANKGGQFNDIKKAASGGELSRIMLAVKSILAKKSKLATLIFDEIDTGVSGDIAKKMGGIMYDMGSRLQVISITHLPQIAAKGQYHYKVYKEDLKDKTVTNLKELTAEERIVELSEMLGGNAENEAVFAHAKSLLKS